MERLVADWTFVRFLAAVRQFVILIVALLMETCIWRKMAKNERGYLKLSVNENDLQFFFSNDEKNEMNNKFFFLLIFFIGWIRNGNRLLPLPQYSHLYGL